MSALFHFRTFNDDGTQQPFTLGYVAPEMRPNAKLPAAQQGIDVYFQVLGNNQVLEEILTAKSKKSNKFLLSGLFFPSFFDLFEGVGLIPRGLPRLK
jgi:hypothetical protein